MKVNILGTDYEIIKKAYKDEPTFEKNSLDGYCDPWTKTIVYCDLDTDERWNDDPAETKRRCEKQTLRHEIVHAFFDESGLQASSFQFNGPYSKNEELIDWIALQGEKIYRAWAKAGALDVT